VPIGDRTGLQACFGVIPAGFEILDPRLGSSIVTWIVDNLGVRIPSAIAEISQLIVIARFAPSVKQTCTDGMNGGDTARQCWCFSYGPIR
jgi:hypothetical protein